jgi:bifunctional non-homologous end joining protein LigD
MKKSATDTVTLTSPERIVYPDSGITKADVAEYYRSVAKWMLPELIRRPLSLVRCPGGVVGECFFQKHHTDAFGESVEAIPLQQKSGKEDYLYIEDLSGLLALVQMNTLEFHPWGATTKAPERPDRLVFDLDPGEGMDWAQVKAAAREVRKRLQEAGLESFVRLSGGKGLHVVVPIKPGPSWEQAKDFCEAIARGLAEDKPQRYLATASKAEREGRIFIDWLRNTRGATSVCSWSLRARPGATVAMPIRWQDLGKVASPDAFTLSVAKARASRLRGDPWADIAKLKQTLPG